MFKRQHHKAQLFIVSPGILPNSRMVLVTKVTSRLSAIPVLVSGHGAVEVDVSVERSNV